MGLALLVVIWAITLISSYFFYAHTWWMPAVASQHGIALDKQFTATYVLMGVVFLAAQLALGLFVWRYRDRANRKATYSHGDIGLETLWTVLTAILFIGLNLAGQNIWASERFHADEAGPNPVQVEVTGVQFAWYFRYPGTDNTFGRIDPKSIDPSAGNESAVGLDPTDPASKDDFVTGTMYLPVNREAQITLRAQDVIHSFYVPAFRFKQDAVPGLAIKMKFMPIKVGDYEIACAELCGLGHYKMHGMVHVVSEQEYERWVQERITQKQSQ